MVRCGRAVHYLVGSSLPSGQAIREMNHPIDSRLLRYSFTHLKLMTILIDSNSNYSRSEANRYLFTLSLFILFASA